MGGFLQAFLHGFHIAFLRWGNVQLKGAFPVVICYRFKMQIHFISTCPFMRFIITEAGEKIKPRRPGAGMCNENLSILFFIVLDIT